MSARRTLFVDEKTATRGVPLTPNPPGKSSGADGSGGGGDGSRRPAAPSSASRTSKQACDEAKLDNTFDHRQSDYHSSQQAALNMELRAKVERVTSEWEKIVQVARQQVELLPERSSTMNYMSYNAMTAYDEGYGCTEDLPFSADRLVQEFHLRCATDSLKELLAQPTINSALISSTLDNLLSSTRAIARLDTVVKEIVPLDVAANVSASVSAAALHEKLHFPLAEALYRELSKNSGPLMELEEKFHAEKTLKEMALENRDVTKAGECLTNQVETSNELLKLNHIRMSIVHMVANEVEEFDKETNSLLDTVHQVSAAMAKNVSAQLEPVQQDIADCRKDKEIAQQQLAATAAAFAKEQADARLQFKEYEHKENRIWKNICELLAELEMTVSEKKRFVWQRLLAKEKHERQLTVEQELVRAQESHLFTLQMCEDYLSSAQRAAQHFEGFANQFDEALRARVQKHYDELHTLQLREASEYVRRYEMFAFGAEEQRAKKQSRLDVMNLTLRNLLLDIEAAVNTLDPNVSRYRQEVAEIQEESTTTEQYLAYLDEMQTLRRTEVEPSTRVVSAFVAQQRLQQKKALRASATPGPLSGRNTSNTTMITDGSKPPPAAEPAWELLPKHLLEQQPPSSATKHSAGLADGTATILSDIAVEDGELPEIPDEDMVHPQIAARHLGLMHEENVTLRAHDYVREELAAIESRMSDIRRAKSDNLRSHESKTTNGEPPLIYIPPNI